MQLPKVMQPTHARWEQVSTQSSMLQDLHKNTDHLKGHHSHNHNQLETLFPSIPPVFTRNYMISDTYYTGPVSATLGYPGPDEAVLDIGPGALAQVPEHVLAALPEGCYQAFIKAKAEEEDWKKSWGDENDDTDRGKLRITYNM